MERSGRRERHIAWTRAFFEAMQPFAERAVYVNGLGAEGEDRVREAYGANYERLAALKARYDPTNLFRVEPEHSAFGVVLTTSPQAVPAGVRMLGYVPRFGHAEF